MESKQIILIGGLSRSGSTMFDLMLGNDPNGFSCGEVYAWFRKRKPHHHFIDCPCGQDPCPKWDIISKYKEENFHRKTLRNLSLDFIIDSSKNAPWLRSINQYYKDNNDFQVVNFLIYKQPMNIWHSFWKRHNSIDRFLQSWINYHQWIFSLNFNNFYTISYESLIENPSESLKTICETIDIPYFEGKERFWEGEHHHLFGSLGTRNQLKSKNPTLYKIEYQENFEIEKWKKIILNDAVARRVFRKLEEKKLV